MSEQIEKIARSLKRWQKYYLGKNLYAPDPDPEYLEQLQQLGGLLKQISIDIPGRFDIADPATSDPTTILKELLKPQFPSEQLEFPEADVAILMSGLETIQEEYISYLDSDIDTSGGGPTPILPEEATSIIDQPATVGEEGGEVEITSDSAALPPPEWRISLFLRKIQCIKETAPAAGQDEFRLFGNYQYGPNGGKLEDAQGGFDTDTQSSFVDSNNPHGMLLATEKVRPTTEFEMFDVNIVAFEDDGMSASSAKLLAGILGGLATLGVNGLLTSATIGGVNIAPQAKQAYDNLGLPALVGVLAKAFGPEPFLTVKLYAKTIWPPATPAEPPKWVAKIPSPGGPRRQHEGEDNHDGNLSLYEATVKESANQNGADITTLVRLVDGGHYYIHLRFRVEKE